MKLLLACVLIVASSSSFSQTSQTVTFPGGSVETTTTQVDPKPQKVVLASPKKVRAINASAVLAEGFVAAYLPAVSNPGLEEFDEAFRRWQDDGAARYTDTQVVSLLGAYLGNKMVADLDMEWVVVDDDSGVDFGVRGRHAEVLAFPFASVEKRVTRKQHSFMVGLYHTLKQMMERGDYKKR
jgi:hypothetical protein